MSTGKGGTPVIELSDVVKKYGDFEAVKGLDLAIPEGSTYALLGPNGAGKTTTIRMILRIIEETSGSVRVFGQPVTQDTLDRIGYLPEERGVYKRMTVRRLLAFMAEMKGVSPRVSMPRIEEWLERLSLDQWIDAKVQELSKGMQQKLQFISSVLHDPPVVILDEPFSGLDPLNQQVLRGIVGDLQESGKTVLFSTHIIEHAERICDHVCIIAQGQKVVDGPLSQVRREHGGHYVAIGLEPGATGDAAIRGSRNVASTRQDGTEFEVTLREGADANALLAELVGAGVRLRRFELVEPSLEQVFIEVVGRPEELGMDALGVVA
ncbi:MAG TPA: ATP-binding cassette domain-containing protein [Longimicrobiales bacterium]|nr:ATP-binding cassette domain-containing protein [Longimicrobiales bacterium]